MLYWVNTGVLVGRYVAVGLPGFTIDCAGYSDGLERLVASAPRSRGPRIWPWLAGSPAAGPGHARNAIVERVFAHCKRRLSVSLLPNRL